MSNLISLGSFNRTNGQNSTFGLASGLDSKALIDGILSGRQTSIDAIKDSIKTNSSKVSAIGDLKTLLDSFKSTADLLRAKSGVNTESSDLFKYTKALLSSNTSISASNYLSVTTEPGATINSYSLANIVRAKANQLKLDGFTSQTASVVGNSSITDNYQVSLGTVAGNVLNPTTPITFSNDVRSTKASIDLTFGSQNQFDAADSVTFGATTITFGGGGGNDISLAGLTTVTQKVAAIAARMNAISTGDEAKYTYVATGTVLTITRDVAGSNSEVVTNLNIDANFSGGGDATQTLAIGGQAAAVNPAAGALNTLGTDGNDGTVATQAKLDVFFNDANQFDSADSIAFGNTTITFGGTGGNDIDISSATTLDQKIDAIVARMNAVATGDESHYTYSRSSTGVLTITRDTAGPIATAGNDITVTANFSKGLDKTQKVGFGANYKNNGSSAGSVAQSNSSVSASVSQNGVDGLNAAVKANISLQFNGNTFAAGDHLVIGGVDLTFDGGGGGSYDVAIGGTLNDTLTTIANHMNTLATGYTYSTNGSDSLVITRNKYGTNAQVGTNLSLSANLSTSGTQVAFGSQGLSATPAAGTLNTLGTEGVAQTAVSDLKTTHLSTLSGAVTIGTPIYIAGSDTANGFIPNTVEFKAIVGGVSYTSKPVVLDGGARSGGGGSGTNGYGDLIAAGTVITFVKDSDSDGISDTKDVTFQLVTGAAKNIADSTAATDFATGVGGINEFLNTNNTITIGQNPTVPPLRAGSFFLGGVSITLAAGDNLQIIKSKINSVSTSSGVQAEIVKISDNNYSLTLKSVNTGVANKIKEYSDGDVGDGLVGTLQFGADNVAFSEVVEASDSSFTLDGQTITRSSNVISDVLNKVTFSLLADTPTDVPPTLAFDVQSDKDIIKSGVNNFITAYNNLKFFIAKQTQRDSSNALVETAVLGDERILSDVMTSIDRTMSSLVKGLTSGDPASLFAIGIDTTDFPGDSSNPATKGIFVLDEAKFDAALASNFSAFEKVFSFNFVSSSPDLGAFSHTDSLSLNNFVLDIDTSRANGDKIRVLDATTNQFLFNADINGSSITGRAGTALEGLIMIYTGDGTDSISVHNSKGIADTAYNILDSFLATNGLVQNTVDSLTSENDRLQKNVDDENASMESERQLLVDKFTKLEAIISSANQTLGFLDSQQASDNKR